MKLNLNFKQLSSLKKIKFSIASVLWVCVGIILVLTGLVVFSEVRKITLVQTDTSGIMDRIVRVKLPQHEELQKKLGENTSFRAAPVEGAEAFRIPPRATD